MSWYKQYDVDPVLKMLQLKGREKEGFVFVQIKGFYSLMKHKVTHEILLLEFDKYHPEIEYLIKEKHIKLTRNTRHISVKIQSMKKHYTKTTQKLHAQHTPSLNSSDTSRRRREEKRQDKEQDETTPTDLTFSTYSECFKWAIKTFKTHDGNQLMFDQQLGKIFNTYKKQKWKDENGCLIANKKGIIIRSMQNKSWHLKEKL